MNLSEAANVAKALRGYLEPACTRIEIAGSIRRRKEEVKDIELVCIPEPGPPPAPKAEFGKPLPKTHKTKLDELVHRMVQVDDIRSEMNGERYKKMYLKYAGIKCDLFIVLPPAEWGVMFTIRTGPSDFSQWCVTNRRHGGALPDGYFVRHGVVWVAEEIEKQDVPDDQNRALKLLTDANHLSMPEEVDFLNFLELGWIEPSMRAAQWRLNGH